MRHLTVVLFVALGVTAAIAPSPSFAQGAIGGTVGKQNKSVTGEDAGTQQGTSRPARKSKPSASRAETASGDTPACGRIVGSWDWGAGGIVTFRGNGNLDMTNGDSAIWTCASGVYTIRYRMFGNTTTGTLSADGNRFSGTGALGSFISNRVSR